MIKYAAVEHSHQHSNVSISRVSTDAIIISYSLLSLWSPITLMKYLPSAQDSGGKSIVWFEQLKNYFLLQWPDLQASLRLVEDKIVSDLLECVVYSLDELESQMIGWEGAKIVRDKMITIITMAILHNTRLLHCLNSDNKFSIHKPFGCQILGALNRINSIMLKKPPTPQRKFKVSGRKNFTSHHWSSAWMLCTSFGSLI